MKTIYFSHPIRGAAGESATAAKQKHNIELACQRVESLRSIFQEVEWYAPHEDELVNRLYFDGFVAGDHLVAVECKMIAEGKFDMVVVWGAYHEGTGVAKEILAAHENGVEVVFIDGIDDESMETLAGAMQELLEGQ